MEQEIEIKILEELRMLREVVERWNGGAPGKVKVKIRKRYKESARETAARIVSEVRAKEAMRNWNE